MNSKPTILVTRKLPPRVEQRLVMDYEVRLNANDRLYGTEELLALADGAAAMVPCHTEKLTEAVIGRLPDSVRILSSFSVGLDHIDLGAAQKRGLVVTNTPGVLNDATAEITMLLLLGAARRASEGERLIRHAAWDTWSPTFMLGTQVSGKRLGIVGMGGVGRVTAKLARGFDMDVHYYNRRRLAEDQEHGACYHKNLESMLPLCDFIALHCPSTVETRSLLNTARIALLPDGAIVVNAARGDVIDEDALVKGLKCGKLAAAGLDVFLNEPDINPAFLELDNVFLLPHLGSATRETRDAMGFTVADNLDAFFAGREPPTRVV